MDLYTAPVLIVYIVYTVLVYTGSLIVFLCERERVIIRRVKGMASFLSLICGFLAAALYLAPIPMMMKIQRNRSVGNKSVVPLVSTFLNASLWCSYGWLTSNYMPVCIVNGVGALLELSYILVFLQHARKTMARALMAAVGGTSIFCFVMFVYVYKVNPNHSLSTTEAAEAGPSLRVQRLGNIGVVMSAFTFVSPFATIRKVIRQRSANSLPFGMILMGWFCSGFWMLYGWTEVGDVYIYGPNTFGFIVSSMQLLVHQRYSNILCIKYFETAKRKRKLQEMSEAVENPFKEKEMQLEKSSSIAGNRRFKVKTLLGDSEEDSDHQTNTDKSSLLRV